LAFAILILIIIPERGSPVGKNGGFPGFPGVVQISTPFVDNFVGKAAADRRELSKAVTSIILLKKCALQSKPLRRNNFNFLACHQTKTSQSHLSFFS
jgi:hypothetical protein